jgi:murein DD-endopeptidase MepM/ murein hydrolase activator NlpD
MQKDNTNNKQEELQVTVIEENKSSNSSVVLRNPIDGDLILLKRFNSAEANGVDIAAPEGKSIYSVNNGEVVDVGNDAQKGNYIAIKYDNNVKVIYSTCSTILKKIGDKVNTGDVVAKTGNTGHSTGPHLHFEIIVNGTQANPEEYLK